MERAFAGKTVLITGAARGMGRSHALAFAREGAIICGLDLGKRRPKLGYELANEQTLEATMSECRQLSKTKASAVFADVTSASELESAVRQVLKEHGQIDVLVNNAGITTGPHFAHELPEEDWDKMLAVTY